ncbi:NAD(P)-dependent alcohol dehydrogenase [Staphylococcus edaphicus]|uniref:Alcohol dehydrogenase n=1 Tax=Staphylococcus edaphicus TaxID=1955013 RepID=A0A2C6WQC8_9STAP|nr:NAD(P)-dependent alcohol dehydrogenase [Staphylococcus edaphicus]PHK49667.1 alcohol dehydrogenase [Staphylococcus edaphicus]UQW81911.1 NAD(P)-dependent alcohol dehydrogenase [Staphylococcus edaphicus]
MTNKVPETMNISLLNKPLDMEIREVKVPQIGATDVLVKVMAVGVCGSDVHYYEHGRVGEFVVEKPLILGHECSGIVAAIGSEVTNFKVGDRVAIESGIPCGECEYCKSGQYNLCPDVSFLATPPIDGAFSQYISHPEGFLFHIPDALSYEEATLNEPFSVGIQACKRASVQPGSTIVIMGMGPVGLMAVVAAKAFGATKIIVSDLEKIRLDEALKLGATHAINIKEEDVSERIDEITEGKGAHYAFETAGNPTALQNALSVLNNGGTLAIVGLPQQENIELNIPFIANHEINIVGIFRYANTYNMGIEMLTSTTADLKTMFTDTYDLNQAKEAMEQARTNKSGSLKVMVYPNGKPE